MSVNNDHTDSRAGEQDDSAVTALVDVSRLNEMASGSREMAGFVPEGHNILRSWYQYWTILRENMAKLSRELESERKRFSSKVDLIGKSLEYAERFASGMQVAQPSAALPGLEALAGQGLTLGRKDNLLTAAERVWKVYDSAEEQVLGPLARRLETLPGEILELVRGLCSCRKTDLEARVQTVIMGDGQENMMSVTFRPAGQLESIFLCYIFNNRIPYDYEFFHEDICSFDSPDGLCWFFNSSKEWAENSEELKEIMYHTDPSVLDARSFIPVILPDQGPVYRIRHGNGMDVLEIQDKAGFRDRLTSDELSRFNGYCIFLGTLRGDFEFRVLGD